MFIRRIAIESEILIGTRPPVKIRVDDIYPNHVVVRISFPGSGKPTKRKGLPFGEQLDLADDVFVIFRKKKQAVDIRIQAPREIKITWE